MTPDRAQQLGNDLAHLAGSISQIAEELKCMSASDHESDVESDASKIQVPSPEQRTRTLPTLEEVRGILADRASSGHREAVQALIHQYGVKKLSDIDPSIYLALIEEASAFI